MKLLPVVSYLLAFCSSAYARAQPNKPYLRAAALISAEQPAVEKLFPLPSEGGSGYGDLVTSSTCSNIDLRDAVAKHRDTYLRCLDAIKFDNCCQPKFLGLESLSPPLFPMRSPSSLKYGWTYGYCDMHTEGGGWMVILRREKGGGIGFLLGISYYKNGFGKLLKRGYWMGLKHMHHFTSQPGGTELMVELMLNGTKYVAHYDDFFVGGESTAFILRVGGYRKDKSNVSDSLSHSSGFNFTAFDSYNFDGSDYREEVYNQTYGLTGFCTRLYYAAWWFGSSGNESCSLAIPTKEPEHNITYTPFWPFPSDKVELVRPNYLWTVDGEKIGFDSIEMKIRPKTWECGTNRYTDQVTRLAFLSRYKPELNPFDAADQFPAS